MNIVNISYVCYRLLKVTFNPNNKVTDRHGRPQVKNVV